MFELLTYLWPDFSFPKNANGLSTLFWIITAVIFSISFICIIYNFMRFQKRMTELNSLIINQNQKELASKRRETFKKAEKLPLIKDLWQAFDETLVVSSDHQFLFNTLDAEHFFNSKTLAPGITGSRLLAAAPGFLVAIGILGTFVGLTVGLVGLQLNEQADINQLKAGIHNLISGAAMAFMTSVWGVLFSLALNIIEKFVEIKTLNKISALQQKIDLLYPIISAEQSLIHISENSRESKDALQELHERIGNRLQETLNGMSEGMQLAITDALNNIMAPAIQNLVNNAGQQSTAALENLISHFMEGMTAAGREQGGFMQQAASNVQSAIGNMSQHINQLAASFDEQQRYHFSATEQQRQQFEEQIERSNDLANARQEKVEQRFGYFMDEISHQLSGQLNTAKQQDETRQALFERLLAETHAGQKDLLEKFTQSSRTQIQAMDEASSERHNKLEQIFSHLMKGLHNQINISEQREQARIINHEQQQANLLTQQSELLGKLGNTSQQQIEAITNAAATQQRNLESTVQSLLTALSSQITQQNKQADEREHARASQHTEQQNAVLAQQSELLGKLGNTSQQQIEAITNAAATQQRNLESTVQSLLTSLSSQINQQNEQSDTRERERQNRLNEQLERMALQQNELLSEIANAVQTTQKQSIQMAHQHQILMTELKQVSSAVSDSSQNINNAAGKLGIFGINIQNAANLLDEHLEEITQRIENAGEQNVIVAQQLQTQANMLEKLQKVLLESVISFEKTAHVASHSFDEMQKHQEEFLHDMGIQFSELGETLREQVSSIEEQAEQWLRSYSQEVNQQVKERMDEWNKQTIGFASQMLAVVTSISNIVDELEAHANAMA